MSTRMQWLVVAASMLATGCRSAPTSAPPSTPTRSTEEPEASLPSHDGAAPSDPGPEPPTDASSHPYADLPPPNEPAKEAYGSPDGWDAARPSGDPWASEVMMALNVLDFPETNDHDAVVRFTLRVCKDGTVRPELVGGTPASPLEEEALAELRSVKVPPPSSEIQAKMRSDCAKLKYVFQWTRRGIR